MLVAGLGEAVAWIGWAVVGVSALTLLTQFLRWSPLSIVGILQSTNVPGTALLGVVAGLALLTTDYLLALAALAVGAVAAASVVRALRPTTGPAQIPEGTPTARVVSANVLYRNTRIVAAADAIAATDPDVVYICEYDAAIEEALANHRLRRDRPHRLEDPRESGAGSVLWSRLPILEADPPTAGRDATTATVDGPFGTFTVLGVHPSTPVHSARRWRDGLRRIRRRAAAIPHPVVVVGDFNATYWHPLYADLTRDGLLLDEHVQLGLGWSTSWPTHRPVPRWARLDHVLTGNGLRAARLDDLDVPGSDHAGVVVDVALDQRD